MGRAWWIVHSLALLLSIAAPSSAQPGSLGSDIEQLVSRDLDSSSVQQNSAIRGGGDDDDDDGSGSSSRLEGGVWRNMEDGEQGKIWSWWSTQVDENQTLIQLASREESDRRDDDYDDHDDYEEKEENARQEEQDRDESQDDDEHGDRESDLPVFQSCSREYSLVMKKPSLAGLYINLQPKKKGSGSSLSPPVNASVLDPRQHVHYRNIFNCWSDSVRCPRAGMVELFGEPKSGTTWLQQSMLTLFGLACQAFNSDDPDHVQRLKSLDESQCFYQCWMNRVYFFLPGNATTQPVVYKWDHSFKHTIPTDGKSGRLNAIVFFMDKWMDQCVKMSGKGSDVEWTRQGNCLELSDWKPTLRYRHHKILLAWRDPRVVMHSGAHYKPQLFFKMEQFSQEQDELIDTVLLPDWLEKTNYKNFVSTLMWMYLRNAWFHTGLIGAQVLTVYYESVRLEFKNVFQQIVEYIGLESFVTESLIDQLIEETSLDSMKEKEEKGLLVQRKKIEDGKYEPPKVGSGIIWMNQTQVPAQVVSTLDRIMCDFWPLELTLHYLDSCEETEM